MHTKLHGQVRKTSMIIAVIAITLLFCLGPSSSSTASAQENKYFTERTIKLSDGASVVEIIINGPPVPPPGYDLQRSAVALPKPNAALGINTLPVPAFKWSFGCSATSGAMIAGYYDRNGFPNMYTGSTNGGVIPLDSSPWPDWTDGVGHTWAQCPLTASHQGLDGRVTRGSIDDYWVSYLSTAQDPYITNGWTQHNWGDAIGDYMKTSQSAYNNNVDGATTFVTYTSNASPLLCSTMASGGGLASQVDGTYGRKLFYEARGYMVTDCYNQKTDNTIVGGFSFAQYKAEIDAGRPVMLELEGHTIVGVGYDDSSNTVYIHDTWDYDTHTMTWGGSYAGMQLLFASIVNLQTNTPMYVKPVASGAGNCQSWDNACSLQTALTNAVSGNEIWVKAGTYQPTTGTDRSLTFQLKAGVALYGGFAGTETARSQRNPSANVTILSGDIGASGDASDNSYHIVTGASGATLDGFTISGGNANGTAPNDRGAGMYNVNCSPTLTNLSFSGNSAVFGGGIFNDTSSPTLTEVTFSGNSASSGGGMYSSHNSPTLTDVNFNNNSASYGGGMVNDNSNPTLTGGAFTGNTASTNGGGMLNGGSIGSSPSLTNVTFNSNSATGNGGGMFNSSSNPTLKNVNFTNNSGGNNTVLNGGGGMYNSYSNPTLTGVIFSSNSAGTGGGMFNNYSNPVLTEDTFSGNAVDHDAGGGMYNFYSSPTLTNVTFSGNTAIYHGGGGMYNDYESNTTLMDVTFSGNSAPYGGGLYISNNSSTLTNVTFSGNSATYGGGMSIANDSYSPTLTNVTFSDNMASDYGGGIYNDSFGIYESNPMIRNAIFWDNTAIIDGSQIYKHNSGSTPSLSYSVVQGGCPAGSTCTNILTADPLLGPLGDYGGFTQTIPLQTGSSAIDTGDDSVCPPTDQRGFHRPYGAHCDIGAYEYFDNHPVYLPLIKR